LSVHLQIIGGVKRPGICNPVAKPGPQGGHGSEQSKGLVPHLDFLPLRGERNFRLGQEADSQFGVSGCLRDIPPVFRRKRSR
jgi:hypothetical protein